MQQVQKITGGDLAGPDITFNSVSIDTRTLESRDLFVAIPGPNFDGNDFVADAEKKQAIAIMVSQKVSSTLPGLRVRDTRLALGQISVANRELSKACVIGLTGSQGKTTVKEMTGEILSSRGEVLSTKGNLNNDLGVPLTLLRINDKHNFAVIEMGASAPGEIAYTVKLVKPDIAHITNTAGTHLAGFGDLSTVAKSKGEIWAGLTDEGIAVINIDDHYAESWQQQLVNRKPANRKIVTVSASGNQAADYFVTDSQLSHDTVSSFELHTPKASALIQLALPGWHNVENALAAAAISLEAGAMIEDVITGLMRLKPVSGRLQCRQGINHALIIDDSYNASPSSFKVAIDVLSGFPGEKILVAGDMGELGSDEVLAHEETGRYARECAIDYLFCVGKLSKFTADGFGNGAVISPGQDELVQKIIPMLKKGVTVLVKGSRSAGMESLVQKIIKKGD